jgi:general secretion pathway protein A
MYTDHFGLRDFPFAITPDPGYLYLSPHHREALAHLLYGTAEAGGFVQLTGEVGTGKTTLIRTLLEQHLDRVDIALCLNPQLTVVELVAAICDELGVSYPREDHTLKTLIDALNAHLLTTHAQDRRTVVIIDEAQHLSREVLEQIRLLTNLETHRHKLLRIILVGQPELRELLARPDLRQLAQRITARYHLPPLNRRETADYVCHRLRVAGGREGLFTIGALRAVYRLTGGVPRLINILCDRALLGAYSQNRPQVDGRLLRQAATEVLPPPSRTRTPRLRLAGELAVLAGLAAVAVVSYWPDDWVDMTTRLPVVGTLGAASSGPASESPVAGQPQAPLFAEVPDGDPLPQLLALWDAEAVTPAGMEPCEAVKQYNLRCLSGSTDWDGLRRTNLPAILTLKSPDGRRRLVLLRALTGETATLELGGRRLELPLAALRPHWTGDYLLLWRPPALPDVIGPGARGEPVTWIRQRLALANGEPPPSVAEPAVYDRWLRRQVIDFQRANALQVDGVVGQRTLILLSSLAPEPGTPSLSPSVSDKVN